MARASVFGDPRPLGFTLLGSVLALDPGLSLDPTGLAAARVGKDHGGALRVAEPLVVVDVSNNLALLSLLVATAMLAWVAPMALRHGDRRHVVASTVSVTAWT